MNFLAHCSLAHDAASSWSCDASERQGLLAGAVIGDFVKGSIPAHWPRELRAGARLHRKIDALSNQHPGVRQHCDAYPRHLRRFAPIFVDVLADHCLATNWTEYYEPRPTDFSAECYDAINAYADYLTNDGRRFCDYMQEVDLLASYHEWPHVARGLNSVLRRLRRPHWAAEVEQTSLSLVPASQEHFSSYFPELRDSWQTWNVFTVLDGGSGPDGISEVNGG